MDNWRQFDESCQNNLNLEYVITTKILFVLTAVWILI